ncbi:MAG: acyl carrier protein [Gammaproteobacteria bacterium]|nr:acyl carrier protein [Gammaproteobacteria bacterium]
MQISINDVLAMLAEVFEESVESLSPERKLESIGGWDSIGVLTLMAELDDQYGVTLTTEEIQNFATIADILAVLKNKGVDIAE